MKESIFKDDNDFFKSTELNEGGTLIKARGKKDPIGTVKTWGGKKYKKIAEGSWAPADSGKVGQGTGKKLGVWEKPIYKDQKKANKKKVPGTIETSSFSGKEKNTIRKMNNDKALFNGRISVNDAAKKYGTGIVGKLITDGFLKRDKKENLRSTTKLSKLVYSIIQEGAK